MKRELHFSDISIGCLLRRLLKDLWMVVAAALIFAMGISILLRATHVDQYRATVSYSITSRRTSYTSNNNLVAAKEAATVLAQVLESSVVRDTLKSDAQLQNFNGSITAKQVEGTNFINLIVTDDSPEDALVAVQMLMRIFPTFTAYLSDSVVQVIRNPAVSASPINAVDVSGTAMKAGILGGCAMTALLCWLYLEANTIHTRSGARHALDSHIIASVCRERARGRKKKGGKAVQVFSPSASFAYTEQINSICARLEQEATSKGSKVFLVTGTGENEGKTTIAANVAVALSLMGKQVALLDCDLRNPSMNRFFDGKYTAQVPLNQLLAQPLSKDNLLKCMQRHEKLGIYMLFPLEADKRCTELLTGDTMDRLLRQLRVFDYVILDTPPMGLFADAEALAERADASMLVVRRDHTSAPEINDVIDILRASDSDFLGCILNDMTVSLTEGYGKGYGYGYSYQYSRYGSGKKSGSHHTRKGG